MVAGDRLALGVAILASGVLAAGSAQAAEPDLETRLQRLEALATAQERRIAEQDQALERQARELADQKAELARLRAEELGAATARGLDDQPVATNPQATRPQVGNQQYAQVEPGRPSPSLPSPVGEAPPPRQLVEVGAIPERSGVLTPKGRLIIEPNVDYLHASTNRLVFRGVEIVTGIQIGVIEASDADRDAIGGSLTARFGLTERLEVTATVPYVDRSDRITTLAQRDDAITRTIDLEGSGLGDVEMAARYQLNKVKPGRPILIASMRVKSDTGISPFDIDRDEFGVAEGLATGSGFWGIEPGLNFLLPTDPVVLFGGLTYLYHVPKDIDRVIGDVLIGRVDPGDSIGFSAGFGFAVNPKFSFSVGYRHNYIYPTESVVGGTHQKSESLQVGAITFAWSYRINDRLTINNSYEIGATGDAPDVRINFRFPYTF